jgi:hypothetical protein
MIILLIFVQLNHGYLNVNADVESLAIYVDDELIGKTPIVKYPLMPGKYNVGFFPQGKVEEASWQLKNGKIGALWKIAKYSEGIVKVRIEEDKITTVTLNYDKVKKAPGKAKLKASCCLGGTFILGVLVTLAVQAIF